MLTRSIVRIVSFCARHSWSVILVGIALAVAATVHTVRDYKINANIDDLMSPHLAWRQREINYHNQFPQSLQLVLVVVDGPTPEKTDAAARALAEDLSKRTDLFRSVTVQGGDAFFQRNAFLYVPPDRLAGMTQQLTHAGPLIG